jgi:ankyrin repeat protein
MTRSRILWPALSVFLASPHLPAQTIDFARQVRPILSDKCYFCHGPAQQMNGLRFDRREAAIGVISKAEGENEFLRRITSQDPSIQMPPWRAVVPLTPAEVETLRTWVRLGALWPEDPPPDPALDRLLRAIARGDLAAMRIEARNHKVLNARDSTGATPLMHAALEGNLASMKLLLEAGGDPNLATYTGSTALLWAVDDLAKVRLLLARGAKPDIRTSEGTTPLIAAAAFRGSTPVLRALLDAGADPNSANSDGSTPLTQAASVGDFEAMKFLIDRGAQVNPRISVDNPQMMGMSPLTTSAYFGTAEMVQFLLERGALVNAADGSGITALHVAVTREDDKMIAALIRAGADVNRATLPSTPASDDPGTPLMLASNNEPANARIASTLLDHGARADAVTREGETAVSRAQKRGQTAVVKALIATGAKAGSDRPLSAIPSDGSPAPDIRTAVEKSLLLLQNANRAFLQRAGCQSCHNDALPSLAIRMAGEFGFSFDRDMARTNDAVRRSSINSRLEKAAQMMDPDGGSPTSMSFALINLEKREDRAANAIARNIAARQLPDGRWRPPYIRHPMENDVTATAISIRALQLYAPNGQRPRYEKQIQTAVQWLSALEPRTTEQRTFQLLGLTWANADVVQRRRRALELWSEQRPDGGWGQLSSLPSDAYATGEVLYALAESGMAGGRRSAYERGVRFLMQTQLPDGSWHVASRAVRFQQHFEAGFPYGKDQFISAAATSWAAMALMLSTRGQRETGSR